MIVAFSVSESVCVWGGRMHGVRGERTSPRCAVIIYSFGCAHVFPALHHATILLLPLFCRWQGVGVDLGQPASRDYDYMSNIHKATRDIDIQVRSRFILLLFCSGVVAQFCFPVCVWGKGVGGHGRCCTAVVARILL